MSVSMSIGPKGTSWMGCMLCGSELDFEGKHRTTGNLGCASDTNPKRRTRRKVKHHVYRYTTVHFEVSGDGV